MLLASPVCQHTQPRHLSNPRTRHSRIHESAEARSPDSVQPSCSSNYRMFDGAHSESRFSEVLMRAIAWLSESDLARLGGEKKQLGTHSVRKGAASYCTGMVNGPSTVQVFLRAGWSLATCKIATCSLAQAVIS